MGRIIVIGLVFVALAWFMFPAGAFIGAGISLDNHLGDTITFDLNPLAIEAAGAAYGLADLSLGITWGVDYDFSTLAGYPYGYGGIGALTDANFGYSLGVSMDETHGAGFDGATFGIPLAEQTMSTTKYNNFISRNDHLQDVQVALPFY